MRNTLATLTVLGAMLTVGTFAGAAQPAVSAASAASAASAIAAPAVSGQLTFLYFKDIEKAAAFYGRILDEKPTLNLKWVKIYRLSPSSSVGLVDGTCCAHRPSKDKPVMVSLVVDSADKVDRWYQRLRSLGVYVKEPPKTGKLVRAFDFDDPEGYTLEVFAWDRPGR